MWWATPLRVRRIAVTGVLFAAGAFGERLQGQAAPAEPIVVYRREVFRYPRGGRPDPFRPLTGANQPPARSVDLALKGIVASPDRRTAVAIILDNATKRTHRLRVGQRLGAATVVGIQPRAVHLLVQEGGAARREVLTLSRGGQREAGS